MDDKKLTYELIEADVRTLNGNVYSEESLRKAAKMFNDKNFSPVVLDTPSYGKVILADVAGKAEAYFDDGKLKADIELMETPSGKIAMKILDSGYINPIAIGHGHVDDDGNVKEFTMNAVALVPRDRPIPKEDD